MKNESNCNNPLLIPLAIIICGALIAMAVLFDDDRKGGDRNYKKGDDVVKDPRPEVTPPDQPPKPAGPDLSNINPVTAEDHVRGNPDAPIVIVEYSDYDCPFCQRFHDTMNQVMSEYGDDDQVAWVYRHLPLPQLHPNATKVAVAAECVARLSNNEGFWKFSDLAFGERGPSGGTDMARLAEFATMAGVSDEAAFNTCVDNEETLGDVQTDASNANQIGGNGTPYSVIMKGDNRQVINGAQPYPQVKAQIDALLN